jgi:hypothetical protein
LADFLSGDDDHIASLIMIVDSTDHTTAISIHPFIITSFPVAYYSQFFNYMNPQMTQCHSLQLSEPLLAARHLSILGL